MNGRREFLTGLSGIGVAAAMFRGDAIARCRREGATRHEPRPTSWREEDFWSQIQRSFDVDRSRINFNNAGICPSPTHVLDQMIRDVKFSNEMPALHVWNILEPRVESVRRDLAREFGCDPEELAITRNASEALEILILGIDLKRR